MSRPRKEFDWKIAENAAALMCTGEEIASLLDISYDTLQRRVIELGYESYAEWYKKYSVDALKALRRWQLESAKKGNATMQIWLGKQYLGQREPKLEFENTDKKVYVNVFDNENPIRKDRKADEAS